MKQYKPIVMRITHYPATDILTESVNEFVQEGKGQEFDIDWVLGVE